MDRFSRDGLVFDVTDAGPRTGEAAVLLHGFPQDRTAWDRVAPLLHAQGLRTLALDQRGYSPGARPSGRAAYRLSECARDVVALLDAAGIRRAHVVGHDWGGAVAWLLAGRHADRLRSATVLSTPHPRAMAASMLRSSQPLKSGYIGFFQLPLVPEISLGRSLEGFLHRALPAEIASRYAARMREPGALTGALGWYRAIPLSFREQVPQVATPTTYVWGRRDPFLGRDAAERTREHAMGAYRFVELDAGHWLPEKRSAEVAAVVLDQVRAVT